MSIQRNASVCLGRGGSDTAATLCETGQVQSVNSLRMGKQVMAWSRAQEGVLLFKIMTTTKRQDRLNREAWQGRVTAKSDGLSPTSGATERREATLLRCPLTLTCTMAHVPKHSHTQINKCN